MYNLIHKIIHNMHATSMADVNVEGTDIYAVRMGCWTIVKIDILQLVLLRLVSRVA